MASGLLKVLFGIFQKQVAERGHRNGTVYVGQKTLLVEQTAEQTLSEAAIPLPFSKGVALATNLCAPSPLLSIPPDTRAARHTKTSSDS